MKEYRAYVLTEEGSVLSVHYLHCDDQQQAIERAQLLAVSKPVELWDPPVRVARLEPKKV